MQVSLFGAAVRIPYSLILFLAAAAVTAIATVLVRAGALRWGWLDRPGPRRVHQLPVPTLGGIAMAAGVLGIAWGAFLTHGPVSALDLGPLSGLTVATLPILALGIWDDLRGVPAVIKLLVQALAAITLTFFGLGIPLISLPWDGSIQTGPLNVPLTVIWVLLVTNAVNLIDGLDGLAAGAVLIACMSLWWVGRTHGDLYVMFLTAAVSGAALGFLFFNFPPAKIFMGDTGSQFLGFCLATLSLIDNRKGTATITLLFPLVAMGVPIVDSGMAFVRRLVSRRSVFQADAEHIHHRLLRIGLSVRSSVLVLWYLCAFLGVMAVVLAALPRHYSWFVLALLAMGLFLAFEVLEFMDRRMSRGPDDSREQRPSGRDR